MASCWVCVCVCVCVGARARARVDYMSGTAFWREVNFRGFITHFLADFSGFNCLFTSLITNMIIIMVLPDFKCVCGVVWCGLVRYVAWLWYHVALVCYSLSVLLLCVVLCCVALCCGSVRVAFNKIDWYNLDNSIT